MVKHMLQYAIALVTKATHIKSIMTYHFTPDQKLWENKL